MNGAVKRNRLLASLPAADRNALAGDLLEMEIPAHGRLYSAHWRRENVYFPTGAVISALCASDGKVMEVHGVGREGIVGRDLLFSGEQRCFDLVCQIAGSMLSLSGSVFDRRMRQSAALRHAVSLYSASAALSLTRSVACNGLHGISQRCARWLLVTRDRVESPEFPLTHELLARMLGVRRSGVSLAVQRLQRMDIIRYRFGRVSIIDRKRLESQSCECYRFVLRETRRILKTSIDKSG